MRMEAKMDIIECALTCAWLLWPLALAIVDMIEGRG